MKGYMLVIRRQKRMFLIDVLALTLFLAWFGFIFVVSNQTVPCGSDASWFKVIAILVGASNLFYWYYKIIKVKEE